MRAARAAGQPQVAAVVMWTSNEWLIRVDLHNGGTRRGHVLEGVAAGAEDERQITSGGPGAPWARGARGCESTNSRQLLRDLT